MPHRITSIVALIAAAVTVAIPARGQPTAFPGADGAGRLVTGGRGGVVYHVTSLAGKYNDPNRTAAGTLAYGLTDANFTVNGVVQPRTIVFDVGGTIDLGSWDTQCRLTTGRNITIAGETAPGGIAIIGGVIKVAGGNTVIRNLTVAPGYGARGIGADGIPDSYVYDAFDISGQGIMIDHCSTFFATDEHISANEFAADVTVQYCNVSQGQNYPNFDTTGVYTGHAFGSLLQMGSGAKLSVHHNLYAHQKGRLPRVGSSVGTGAINDFRNNVFYNWLGTAGTGASGQPSFNNFVGNFFLAGPGGLNAVGGTTTAITTTSGGTTIFNGASSSVTRVYHSGNLKDTNKDGDRLDATALTNSDFSSSTIATAPYDAGYAGITDTGTAAFERVLSFMGARWWTRDGTVDSVDERIIQETRTGTGQIIAWADDPSDPNDAAEWNALKNASLQTRPAGWDTDADGMPDAWERSLGLDPAAANNNGDFDADGYTDLEEYLQEVTAWPAPKAAVFTGSTGRYALASNWDTAWQPSRFDTVQVNSGTATVDAVGQHGGTLQLSATTVAGRVPTLAVTAGSLRLAGNLVIGSATGSAGRVDLSGGRLVVAGTIATGSATSGLMTLTGGTLAAGRLDLSRLRSGTTASVGVLRPDGATLAPGDVGTAGRMTVTGSVAFAAGSLAIDLGGTAAATVFQSTTAAHDQLEATGAIDLGQAGLALTPSAGYAPAWLVPHTIVTAATLTGRFSTIDGLDLGGGRRLAVTYSGSTATVMAAAAGDVNLDGTIDILDVAAFSAAAAFDAGTQATWADGDFTGDGVVDILDAADFVTQGLYDGAPYAGLAAQVAPVPEPAVSALLPGAAWATVARLLLARRRSPE
ncbi:MAG: dockerin type I domain-containing protein [Planctomycetaceae bacterium]